MIPVVAGFRLAALAALRFMVDSASPSTVGLIAVDCLIGLGANLGNREQSLRTAWRRLTGTPGVTAVRMSNPIETEPVGGPPGQPMYLNAVGRIRTTLAPTRLLDVLNRIETDLGRERNVLWGARTIDLDILLFGNDVIATGGLTIPHPRMCTRRFVLKPALEVAPEMIHPGNNRTIRELFEALTDAVRA